MHVRDPVFFAAICVHYSNAHARQKNVYHSLRQTIYGLLDELFLV
jgi:hypothetical protein